MGKKIQQHRGGGGGKLLLENSFDHDIRSSWDSSDELPSKNSGKACLESRGGLKGEATVSTLCR